MEVHKPHQRRQEEAQVSTETPLVTEVDQAAGNREPMGTIGGWMIDFGVLGAVTGLVVVLVHLVLHSVPAGASLLSFLALAPLLIGFAGAAAGATAGMILRVLRGKISAVWGVFLAAFGANSIGSMVTVAAHNAIGAAATSVLVGQAEPLSLAVLLLIPVVAVLRWREQSTLPWMVLFGAIVGLLIGI